MIGAHSVEEAVASNRHTVAAVGEVAGMSRRIVVAAEDRHSCRIEVEVSCNRRIPAEVGCSASVALCSCGAGRKLGTDGYCCGG